jgi:hypothetical protein
MKKRDWKLAKDLQRGDYILDPGTGLPAEVWEVQLDETLNGAWILYGRVQPRGRIALTVPQDTQVYLYHPVIKTEPAPPEHLTPPPPADEDDWLAGL